MVRVKGKIESGASGMEWIYFQISITFQSLSLFGSFLRSLNLK